LSAELTKTALLQTVFFLANLPTDWLYVYKRLYRI